MNSHLEFLVVNSPYVVRMALCVLGRANGHSACKAAPRRILALINLLPKTRRQSKNATQACSVDINIKLKLDFALMNGKT